MNIAILGFGVVGKGICKILTEKKDSKINVVKILDRKAKDKNFINEKYVFWDEPEKYKVGDILTLTNIKQ